MGFVAKICVIDDEPDMLRLLDRILQDSGLDVDAVESGASGLAMTLQQRYDLVILDLMLPDVDGVTVLQDMRAALPDIQVMVLSAADDAANRVRCLDLGASDFVGKPFDVAELLARVRTRLRSAPQRRSPAPRDGPEAHQLTVGDVTLDLVRHVVRVRSAAAAGTPGAKTQVELAPREFSLLTQLMGRAGEVCTREQLLRDVWGFAFDPGTNILEVYVSRLRNKLPSGLIETVRSVGYTFLAA